MMKRFVIAGLALLALGSVADAKQGKGVAPIPPSYDYAREKAPGYKKDYCEDSVGNHIYCNFKADYEKKQ